MNAPNTASNAQKNLGAKSADARAQRDRILDALRLSPQTTYDLRRAPVASYQNPTRIHELRKLGYEIDTSRVTAVDQDGFMHPRVALYTLISEPVVQEVANV